jgi:hypothetical protein
MQLGPRRLGGKRRKEVGLETFLVHIYGKGILGFENVFKKSD